jgi:hypothetical protein
MRLLLGAGEATVQRVGGQLRVTLAGPAELKGVSGTLRSTPPAATAEGRRTRLPRLPWRWRD